ncbi:MAG: peptidase [Actinomycetota bacterium]|nr:peptidase [Actinomycetota bacterium]
MSRYVRAGQRVPRAVAATRRRITRLTYGVLAALALTAAVAAPASAATAAPRPTLRTAGGIGLRLVDAPLDALADPRARVYIVDHLAPGAVIHRRIEVSNTTSSTQHIVLYAAAATVASGSFLGAAGHTPNDVSMWTSVRPGASDVPAGGRVIATVTVIVPSDAAPGEQYGVVWAESRSAPAAAGGVVEVNRVGIRIYLSVGLGGPPAANFTIDSLTAERSTAGQPIVLASVHNTGGRALDMSGALQLLDGPGGLRAGPFAATLGITLGIGDTEFVMFTLDTQLPAGPWDAQISLRSGLLERTARAAITFPDSGAAPPVSATSIRPRWLYPALAGFVVLLLLGTGGMLVELGRRGGRSVVRGLG